MPWPPLRRLEAETGFLPVTRSQRFLEGFPGCTAESGRFSMSAISSITNNLSHATKEALGGALHPLRKSRLMGRLVDRAVHKPGTPPGSLTPGGGRKVEEVRLRLFEYDPEKLREVELSSVEECFPTRDNPPVGWVNVDGLHDERTMAAIRDHFNIHLLVMEDVVSLGQRAKMEEYEGYIFLVIPMLSFHPESLTVEMEQLSLIIGPGWVLTFQERPGDVFEPVRERIRTAYGRIRQRGPDYLAYALIDAVVDRYFLILEQLGDVAEDLDLRILNDTSPEVLQRVSHLKRELLLMRKAVWPLREALSALVRTESPLVTESTQIFIRDVHDHAIQIIDTVETLRDLTSSMTDLFMSTLGQRTNDVMKVLTIMASIFIPLTFIAGIYGMNFEYMPELRIPWAYPALWGIMLVLAGGMVVYFRRKGWL
jgi:magnesium transporter